MESSCLLCYSGSSRTLADTVPFSVDGVGIDGSVPIVWSLDNDKNTSIVSSGCCAACQEKVLASSSSSPVSVSEITAAIFADPAVNPYRKRLLALWLQCSNGTETFSSLPVPKFVSSSSSSTLTPGKEDGAGLPSPVPLETVTSSNRFTQALTLLQDILQENINGGKSFIDELLLKDIIPIVYEVLNSTYNPVYGETNAAWALTKEERNTLKNEIKNAGGKDTSASIPILRSTLMMLITRHIPHCSSLVKAIVHSLILPSSSTAATDKSATPTVNSPTAVSPTFSFGFTASTSTVTGTDDASSSSKTTDGSNSKDKSKASASLTALADMLLDGKSKSLFDKVKDALSTLANHGFVPTYTANETVFAAPELQVPTLTTFNACTSQPALVYNPSTGVNDNKPGVTNELSTLEILVRYSDPLAKAIPLPPEKASSTSTSATTGSSFTAAPAYVDDGYGEDENYDDENVASTAASGAQEEEEGMQIYDSTTYTYKSAKDKKNKGKASPKAKTKKPFSGPAITKAILNRSDLFALDQAFTFLGCCIDVLRLIINPYRKLLPNTVLLLDLLFLGGPTTLYTSITGVAPHCTALAATATTNTAIKGSITLSVRNLALTETAPVTSTASPFGGYQTTTTATNNSLPFENHVMVTTLQSNPSLSTSSTSSVASTFGSVAPTATTPNNMGLGSISMSSALAQLSNPSGYYNGSTYVHPIAQAGSVSIDMFGETPMPESLLSTLEAKSTQIQESIEAASIAAATASGYYGSSAYGGSYRGRGGGRGGRGGSRGGKGGRGGHKSSKYSSSSSRSKTKKGRTVGDRIRWSLLLPHYRNAIISTSSTMLSEPMINCDCIMYGLLVLRVKESGILRSLTTSVGRLLAQVAAMDDPKNTDASATSNIGSSSSSSRSNRLTVKDIAQLTTLSRVCIGIYYGCGTTSLTDSLASTIKAFDKTISSLSFAEYPAVYSPVEKTTSNKLTSNASYANLNALSTASDNFKQEEESFNKDGKDRRLYTALRKAIQYITNESIDTASDLPAVLYNLERLGRLCIPVLTPFPVHGKTDTTKTVTNDEDEDIVLPSSITESSSSSSSSGGPHSSATSDPEVSSSYTDATKTLLYTLTRKLDTLAQARVVPLLRSHQSSCPNRHAYRIRMAQRQLSLIENEQPTNAIITQNVSKSTGNVNLTLNASSSSSNDDTYWTNYAYDTAFPRKILQKQNPNVRNMIDIALASALRLLSFDLNESVVDTREVSGTLDTLANSLPSICEIATETLTKAIDAKTVSSSSSSSSSSSNLIIVSSSGTSASTGKSKVEVTKTYEGVNAVLNLVETLASHSSLVPVLLTAPPNVGETDTGKTTTVPVALITALEKNPKTGKLVIEGGCLAETVTSVQADAKTIVAKADQRKTKLLAKQAARRAAEEKQKILADARKAAKEAAQEAKETAIKLIQEKRKNAKGKSSTTTTTTTSATEDTAISTEVTAEPETEIVEVTKSGRPKRKNASTAKAQAGIVVKEVKGMVKSKVAAKKSSKKVEDPVRYSILPYATSLFSYVVFQSVTTAGYSTVLDMPAADFLDPDYQESTYCSLCSKYFESPLYVFRHILRKHTEYLVSYAAPMEVQIAAASGEIDDCVRSTFATFYANEEDDEEEEDTDSLWDELDFLDDDEAAELKASSGKSKKSSKGKKGGKGKKVASDDEDDDDGEEDDDKDNSDDDTVVDTDEKGEIKESMVVLVARRILRVQDKVLRAIEEWTSDPNHVKVTILPAPAVVVSSTVDPADEVIVSSTTEVVPSTTEPSNESAPDLSRTVSNSSVTSEFGARASIDPVFGILGRTSSLVPGLTAGISPSASIAPNPTANTDPVLLVPPNEILGDDEKSSIFVRRQLGHSSIRQARVYVPRDVRSAYQEAMGDERYFVVEGLKDDHEFKKGGFSTAGVGTPSQSGQFHTKHKKQMSNELRNFETDTSIISWGSSILVRADASDIDILRAVITGADSTPYANGFFVYDIFVPPAYPTVSPMVVITTRGHGKVRFNPNLYSSGKVCLSLLGTWSGPGWSPETSTIYQVLLSIQSIVMNRWPQENEPSMESTSKTLTGKLSTSIYHLDIRIATLRYAMLEHLLRPVKGFERAIKVHFFYKRDEIKAQAILWAEEAILLARYQFEMYRLQAMDPTVIFKRVKKLITQLQEKQKTSLLHIMTPSYSVFEGSGGESMNGVYIPNNLPLAPSAVSNRFSQTGSSLQATNVWSASTSYGGYTGAKMKKAVAKKPVAKKYSGYEDDDGNDDELGPENDDDIELEEENDDDNDITLPVKKSSTTVSKKSSSSSANDFSALKDLPYDEALKNYLQGIYPGSTPSLSSADNEYIDMIMDICFADNSNDEETRSYAIKAYKEAMKAKEDYSYAILQLSEHIAKFNEEYNSSESIVTAIKKSLNDKTTTDDDNGNENDASSAFTFTKAAKKMTKKPAKPTEEDDDESTATSNVAPAVLSPFASPFGTAVHGRAKGVGTVASTKPYDGPRNIADLGQLLWKLRLRVVQSNLQKMNNKQDKENTSSSLSSFILPGTLRSSTDSATVPSSLPAVPPSNVSVSYALPKDIDTETLIETIQSAQDRLIYALSSVASSPVGNAATSSSFLDSLDEKPSQPSNLSYIQSAFTTLMNAINAAEILARLVTDGEETLTNNEKLTITEDKYIKDRLFPTDWDILRHYRGACRPFWQAWSTIRTANELFDALDKLTEKDLEEESEFGTENE